MMGGSDDPTADNLGKLLTYGAQSDEETPGQPNSAPTVKSDASAPNASSAHIDGAAATTQAPPPSQASQAPIYNPPDTTALTEAQGRLQADQQTSNVQPKWYERIGGGLTAAAMAFDHMPGAVAAGSSVTNRRQNQAEEQRAGRVRADESAIQAWQDGQKQNQQDFQNKNEAYRSQQEGARTDIEANGQRQQQSNADRTFDRETKNDKFNQDRESKNDTWEHGFKLATQNENIRHDKADESISRGNLSVSQRRETRESKKQAADDKLSAPEVRQQQLANQTQDKYRTQVQQLEDGDPKGTEEAKDGFKQKYSKAAASDTNPDTSEKWASPQEKETYLQNLKQQNADRKNSLMQNFAEEMNRLGVPTPVVVFDADGKSKVQTPTGGTQGAPTAAPSNGTIAAPPQPGARLTDAAIVKKYLDAAGGDKAKARQLAQKDKWQF